MPELADLVARLEEMGGVRVLDLYQAAFTRGILHVDVHNGVYYFLPPPGVKAARLKELFDEFLEADALHLSYNAQSAIDMDHKTIIPLDEYIETHFGDPQDGLLKVTAVAREKVAELNFIIESLKKPFSPATFPRIGEINLSGYRAAVEGSQGSVRLKLAESDWKGLIELEEAVKGLISDSNLVREIVVNRHGVKGLEPEILLVSTEKISEKGRAFMAELAAYLEERGTVVGAPGSKQVKEVAAPADREKITRIKEVVREVRPEERYRNALETMGATMRSLPAFRGLTQTVAGNLLLIEFPGRGLAGLGGHFGKEHRKTLVAVYPQVRAIFGLQEGWKAIYRYDSSTRTLSIRAGAEDERVPGGWNEL